MRRSGNIFYFTGSQQGMALISALLLLMVVSLIAVGMSTDTSMDVRIAGYQKYKAVSFGNADAGINAGTEVLEDNIYDAGWTDLLPLPVTYPYLSAAYNPGTIQIMQDENFYMQENFNRLPYINITGQIAASVVVQKVNTKPAEGGASQMAAGYEGLGKGAGGGGIHAIYNFEGTGTAAAQARTEIGVHYRHVTD